eukprot:m.73633 g.73633  ORF g.73633 m.73633 type:complete len:64 (-) comp14337_c0_seq8:1974-2165(-)
MTAVMTQLAPASDQGWRCDLCNKSFLRKEHLIRHNRVHADTNRHECPICKLAALASRITSAGW